MSDGKVKNKCFFIFQTSCCILSNLILTTILWGMCFYFHFRDKETETERGWVTCSRSQPLKCKARIPTQVGLTANPELFPLHQISSNNRAENYEGLYICTSWPLLEKFLGVRFLGEKDMHVFVFGNILLKYPL